MPVMSRTLGRSRRDRPRAVCRISVVVAPLLLKLPAVEALCRCLSGACAVAVVLTQWWAARVRAGWGVACVCVCRRRTGTIDSCGWPNATADTAGEQQYHRQDFPMYENFSHGLTPDTLYVLLQKGCCVTYPLPKYSSNIVRAKAARDALSRSQRWLRLALCALPPTVFVIQWQHHRVAVNVTSSVVQCLGVGGGAGGCAWELQSWLSFLPLVCHRHTRCSPGHHR